MLVGERAFERAHEDHIGAMRRDTARNRQRNGRRVRADRDDAHARLAHAHTRDPDGLQRRHIGSAQSLARTPQRRAGRRIRAGARARHRPRSRLHAPPRRSPRPAAAPHRSRAASRPRIDPCGRGLEQHRRIGPGIRDAVRPRTAHPSLQARSAPRATAPSRSRLPPARGLPRRPGPVRAARPARASAATRASTSCDRRQARDALPVMRIMCGSRRIGGAARHSHASGQGPAALDAAPRTRPLRRDARHHPRPARAALPAARPEDPQGADPACGRRPARGRVHRSACRPSTSRT